MLAPAVVMMRLPLIALEAASGAPRGKEMLGAIDEKAAAAVEGMFAAQASMLNATLSFWPEFFSGRTPALLSGAAWKKTIAAAARPAGRRVRKNFERLSKTEG